jgi:alginate O-acetyltransferase complex protein AlgI
MVFSSSLFLLFFLPLFLLGYFLVPYRYKNAWTLVASVLFYTWGAPVFVFVLIASIAVDFFIARQFEGANAKQWLWVALLFNIGLLVYFKYANFFVDNINSLLTRSGFTEMGWTEVLLPIGISFFTFQKISYLVDVYRGVRAPLKRFHDYALYVILFPQLIAGPIVRYNEISEELANREDNINADNRLLGMFRFALGLAKKVLIANVLGAEADRVFGMEAAHLQAPNAWYGVLCYTFQIYFDFSGYSDMAIGIGRMLGFTFPENFRNPYISGSITEFWRRWHITLSTWMRDYLYIPLGGNKVSEGRLYVNLWTVFLISGLWHGAAWTFVIWGAYHGALLVMERLFLLKFYERLPRLLRTATVFVLVMIGWVFFRAESLNLAWEVIESMFSLAEWQLSLPEGVGKPARAGLAAALLFSFLALIPGLEEKQEAFLLHVPGSGRIIFMWAFSVLALTICAGVIAASGFNPFIYFRF